MLRRKVGIFAVLILFCWSLSLQADDTLETKELRDRIRALEERVQSGKPVPASEHPWYERVAFSGGILSALSRTSGYSDVAKRLNKVGFSSLEEVERLDMSTSVDLFVEYPVGMHGLASTHLSLAKGDGVNPELTEASGLTPFADDTEQDLTDNNKLLEAWYEGKFFRDHLLWTFGILDGTVYIDANEVAHDETKQFMNAAFYNSPIHGIPSYSPGMRVTYGTPDGFYGTLLYIEGEERGSAQERLFARSNDFSTVYAAEVGCRVTPGGREGNYRIYAWKDTTDFDCLNGTGTDGNQGVGLSFDQEIGHQVVFFGRYSAGEKKVLHFDRFYNIGFLLEGERNALGFAAGVLRVSGEAKKAWTAGKTTLLLYEKDLVISELFCRCDVTETLSVTPDLQYTRNSQGSGDLDGIWVANLRLNVTF